MGSISQTRFSANSEFVNPKNEGNWVFRFKKWGNSNQRRRGNTRLFQRCYSSFNLFGHFPFRLVSSKWNACSTGFRLADWLGHCRTFHFFAFKNSLVAFALCFGSIVHLHCEASSNEFWSIWLNIARKTSEFTTAVPDKTQKKVYEKNSELFEFLCCLTWEQRMKSKIEEANARLKWHFLLCNTHITYCMVFQYRTTWL